MAKKKNNGDIVPALFMLVLLTVMITSFVWVVISHNRVQPLGQAICEEEYNMDFDKYVSGELYCKPPIEKDNYDGIVVKLKGG